MYPVLLHPDLYEVLRQTAPSGRARVWKTLARLRSGQWGGGTRVKRLRGIGRPVYEARTDSGDRLLFTVARSAAAGQPDRLVSHLQVWDWVEHDDAVRVARRNRAPEAEFLELEAVEQFEIAEPPPFPGAGFDDIPAEAGGTEGEADPLLRFLLPPDGAEPPPAEDLHGGIRWFQLAPAALASEADFQRLLDQGGDELALKLTREQYEILDLDGPVLLAGSAGSGKTTIAVHRLAAAEVPGRALYLSYSAPLVEHARGLYRGLLLSRGAEPEVNPPDFFTFGDLYRSLVPRDFREHQARPMTEPLFRKWFRKAGRSLDPALVWEELRSILKGACLSPSQAMLDEAAYYELGRKRAPLFVNERPEIYRIAQRYQAWLAEEGRSDRIDLCRRALKELRKGRPRLYDTVICDEVQDLTELEVSFVLSLSARADLSGVLLGGDTQQIVNPSGFRWAEVRRLAGKIGHRKTGPLAPEVRRLRRNLRSARPLVELANALLLLRREVFGRTEGDEPEEAAIEGPVPLQVAGDEDAVLAALEGFGPRAAVLTLDDAEAERLRARLGTTRVFHVREAKGLEFDAVVLWKLLDPDRDLVERFLRGGGDGRLGREPRFEHLLRHLYVGVTRARRHVALYEGGREHPFWSQPRFRGRIEPETLESLAHLFRPTASPADWAREGDWFFERGRFRQAAECYRRGGLPEREAEALACSGEALEDWTGALEHWKRLGMPGRQAPLLERLGRLADAARLYREAGQEEAAHLCELRQLEQRNAWREAAAGWEERGRQADAARCWARAGEEHRARLASARAAEASGDWTAAAETWAGLDDHAAAARCHAAAGDRRRATLARARLCESARRWARAAAAYRLGGEPEAAERCRARALEGQGRLEEAARAWERLGELDRAVELYDRAERWLDVARLEGSATLRESGRSVRKIRELVESGAWEQAGPLAELRLEMLRPRLEPDIPWFLAPEEARHAWQELRLLDDLENRCRALRAEAQGAWSRAARCWQKSGDHDRAAAAWGRRFEPIREAQPQRALAAPGRPLPARPGGGRPAKAAEAKRARHDHPEPAAFRIFLQGRSEGDGARQIVRHLLAGCPECGRRLTAARDAALSGKALSYDAVFDRLERRVTGTLERRQIEEKAAPELYEELFRHEAIEGLIQVHSTRRYASIALCELLLQKSRELCAAAPAEAHTAARLAVAVAEQLDLDLYGSPVVQDLRALTWAYVGDVQRVMADLRSARSCLDLAGCLIEEGTGDPLLEAELLSLEASFLCQSGDFEPAVRLLNRACSIYRRGGDRHLVGRTMIKKGTVLGNAGEAATAARLIRRGIDLIDLPREPRLMVYAVHNLIWFLHDTGQRGQARACIEGTRSLYRQGSDRRQLGRLRWLEGKLASADPGFAPDKAEGALAEAQETLIKEGLSYEAALAAVDLACLYAGEGRGAEMRRQAARILPLFQAGEMYRETVTALMTFQKCQHDVDPAVLLRELSGYVHRVRDEKNPKWLSSALPKGGLQESSRPPLAP